MPFDGTEFSHALRSHVPSPASSSTRTPLVAWLQRLFLGDAGYAKLLYPGQPGRVSEMPAARLLIAARALIENEQAWVQGAYYTPDRKRCAVGALRAATQADWHGSGTKMEAHALLLAVASARGFDKVETMNDNSTHAEVLSAFDEAIARAQRGGRAAD